MAESSCLPLAGFPRWSMAAELTRLLRRSMAAELSSVVAPVEGGQSWPCLADVGAAAFRGCVDDINGVVDDLFRRQAFRFATHVSAISACSLRARCRRLWSLASRAFSASWSLASRSLSASSMNLSCLAFFLGQVGLRFLGRFGSCLSHRRFDACGIWRGFGSSCCCRVGGRGRRVSSEVGGTFGGGPCASQSRRSMDGLSGPCL